MISKLRQSLAKLARSAATAANLPPPVIEKPTAVLANLIAAEILMGNFKMVDKTVDNGAASTASYSYNTRHQALWMTTVESEKFTIMIDSYFRVAGNSEILTERQNGYLFRLRVLTPSVSFEETDREVIALALKKRRWQEIQEEAAERKFKEEQRALDAIENWMGIKPEPTPTEGL